MQPEGPFSGEGGISFEDFQFSARLWSFRVNVFIITCWSSWRAQGHFRGHVKDQYLLVLDIVESSLTRKFKYFVYEISLYDLLEESKMIWVGVPHLRVVPQLSKVHTDMIISALQPIPRGTMPAPLVSPKNVTPQDVSSRAWAKEGTVGFSPRLGYSWTFTMLIC